LYVGPDGGFAVTDDYPGVWPYGSPVISSSSGKLAHLWSAPVSARAASTIRARPPSSTGGCRDHHSVSHPGGRATWSCG